MGSKAFLVPLLLTFYLPVAFFTTYGIAVGIGHVYAGFPYISDTGSLPPESCIFGQFLNIYAFLALLFMLIRYSQIKEHYFIQVELGGITLSQQRLLLLNKISLALGILASLGASMVGNFQEDNVLVVHVIGAFMAFGLGGIYAWIQMILSYRIPTLAGSSKYTRYWRLVLCFTYTLSFILMVVFTAVSMQKYKGNLKKWKPGDPGYDEHLVATITEWLLSVLLSIYFSTFIKEYRFLGVKANVILIQSSIDERQIL